VESGGVGELGEERKGGGQGRKVDIGGGERWVRAIEGRRELRVRAEGGGGGGSGGGGGGRGRGRSLIDCLRSREFGQSAHGHLGERLRSGKIRGLKRCQHRTGSAC